MKILYLLLISNEFTGKKRYVLTDYEQICSDVGLDDLLRNECYEAAKDMDLGEFEEMTPPNKDYPNGCFKMGTSIPGETVVFWNIGKKGAKHPAAAAICFNPHGITTTTIRPNRKLSSNPDNVSTSYNRIFKIYVILYICFIDSTIMLNSV